MIANINNVCIILKYNRFFNTDKSVIFVANYNSNQKIQPKNIKWSNSRLKRGDHVSD